METSSSETLVPVYPAPIIVLLPKWHFHHSWFKPKSTHRSDL